MSADPFASIIHCQPNRICPVPAPEGAMDRPTSGRPLHCPQTSPRLRLRSHWARVAPLEGAECTASHCRRRASCVVRCASYSSRESQPRETSSQRVMHSMAKSSDFAPGLDTQVKSTFCASRTHKWNAPSVKQTSAKYRPTTRAQRLRERLQ